MSDPIHNGKTWRDMPGGQPDMQKLNFSLFKRGKYDPDLPRSKRIIMWRKPREKAS